MNDFTNVRNSIKFLENEAGYSRKKLLEELEMSSENFDLIINSQDGDIPEEYADTVETNVMVSVSIASIGLLNKLREKSGFSHRRFAGVLGITRKEYSDILAGEVVVTLEDYRKYTAIYNRYNSLKKPEKTLNIATMTAKGGCGKTTVTQNLCYELSKRGYNVLMVDTDAQCNLTASFDIAYNEVSGHTFRECFLGGVPADECIINTKYPHLDIIPGSLLMCTVESELASVPFKEEKVKTCFEGIVASRDYDFIFFDCNTNLGQENTSVVCACDKVLVPVQSNSVFNLDAVQFFIEWLEPYQKRNENLSIAGLVMTMYKGNLSTTKQVVDVIEDMFGELKFDSVISHAESINKAQCVPMPVQIFDKNSKSAEEFKNLADEFVNRVC